MSGQTEAQRKPKKNIHLEVSEEFHQRLKLLCVMRQTTLRGYGLEALKEKVARDDRAIGRKRR